MAELFNAPIPGQSLTDEPKNYPWERPPEITDPREAIKYHIDGLNNINTIDNVVELMQIGVPVRSLAKTVVTTAQMEGIHSVDVSLMINDIIYEELISIASEAGVDYTTGDEPSEIDMKEKEEQSTIALLRRKLDAMEPGSESDDAGVELMRQTADMMEDPSMSDEMEPLQEEQEAMPMMEAPLEELEQEAPRGLMARG